MIKDLFVVDRQYPHSLDMLHGTTITEVGVVTEYVLITAVDEDSVERSYLIENVDIPTTDEDKRECLRLLGLVAAVFQRLQKHEVNILRINVDKSDECGDPYGQGCVKSERLVCTVVDKSGFIIKPSFVWKARAWEQVEMLETEEQNISVWNQLDSFNLCLFPIRVMNKYDAALLNTMSATGKPNH